MSTPFAGEIRLWAITYAPKGWSLCQGQILQIQQNQALFALLGNTFGGDGQTTFGLPNLQGRVPMGVNGKTTPLGATGGEASHTLALSEIPSHSHPLVAKAGPAVGFYSVPSPSRAVAEAVAVQQTGTTPVNNFGTGSASVPFAGDAVGNNAGGQGHENRQPFLALNYCIAIQGIFPSRS